MKNQEKLFLPLTRPTGDLSHKGRGEFIPHFLISIHLKNIQKYSSAGIPLPLWERSPVGRVRGTWGVTKRPQKS